MNEQKEAFLARLDVSSYQIVTSTSVKQNITQAEALNLIVREWAYDRWIEQDNLSNTQNYLESLKDQITELEEQVDRTLDKLRVTRL